MSLNDSINHPVRLICHTIMKYEVNNLPNELAFFYSTYINNVIYKVFK